MECPNCHQKISGKECPKCGREIPEEGLFCMFCGASLEMKDAALQDQGDDDFDFENRVLCPDGACTGIIVDGKCTECGRPC